MKRYAGSQPGDERAISGARYLKQRKGPGAERFNFLKVGGKVFGYFRPTAHTSKPSINLKRIKPGHRGNRLDGVTVIFVAPAVPRGGQRVVGWYRNAAVLRHPQPSANKNRQGQEYFISADEAVLVPFAHRSQPVPSGRGAFGRANVCYPYGSDGTPIELKWLDRVIRYVNAYTGENLVERPRDYFGPESYEEQETDDGGLVEPNAELRKMIEKYSVQHATMYFAREGYRVVPRGKPYDLLCHKAGTKLFVEVKGTRGHGTQIILTRGEVRHALQSREQSVLYILHSINVTVDADRGSSLKGGQRRVIRPWHVEDGVLEPIQYRYLVPSEQRPTSRRPR